eukprot:266411_1
MALQEHNDFSSDIQRIKSMLALVYNRQSSIDCGIDYRQAQKLYELKPPDFSGASRDSDGKLYLNFDVKVAHNELDVQSDRCKSKGNNRTKAVDKSCRQKEDGGNTNTAMKHSNNTKSHNKPAALDAKDVQNDRSDSLDDHKALQKKLTTVQIQLQMYARRDVLRSAEIESLKQQNDVLREQQQFMESSSLECKEEHVTEDVKNYVTNLMVKLVQTNHLNIMAHLSTQCIVGLTNLVNHEGVIDAINTEILGHPQQANELDQFR